MTGYLVPGFLEETKNTSNFLIQYEHFFKVYLKQKYNHIIVTIVTVTIVTDKK